MNTDNIAGVIIAGGTGSRMGFRDKPLLDLGGRTILSHIIERARAQVAPLLLNVNRNTEAYAVYGLPLVSDSSALPQGAGPLAGIMAAMEWLQLAEKDVTHLACFPGDTPWFPHDIVATMAAPLQAVDQRIAWIATGGQLQPLFSLWPLSLLPQLRKALAAGHYSPRYFIEAQDNQLISLEALESGMFMNINEPESLARALAHAKELDPAIPKNIP